MKTAARPFRSGPRLRLAGATAGAALSALACLATIVDPRWFEHLFDASPDAGDGSLETAVAVIVSGLACAAFSWAGRRAWRKGRSAPAEADPV